MNIKLNQDHFVLGCFDHNIINIIFITKNAQNPNKNN